ncbi:MAG: hydrogenase formation protein HypD [Endomicrobiia bacterium]
MKNPLVEFKNLDIVKKEIEKINFLAKEIKKDLYFMEVCGTHTMQISKYGIRKILPQNIKLISGPGCPVCVTPQLYIEKALYIIRNYNNIILTTFGDLFRVPGSSGTLEEEKSSGKDIRIVYSAQELINIAENNKNKIIVFLSIGFETTLPTIACVIKEAKEKNIKNLFFLLGNKFFLPEALETVIIISKKQKENFSLDGFILPGHLSSVTGVKPYYFIKEKYNLSGVITGFEPLDIVISIRMLLEIIKTKKPQVKNEYTRVVKEDGNTYAQKLINEVFDKEDGEWRGLGIIKNSSAKLKKEYENFDITKILKIPEIETEDIKLCKCKEVLVGKIQPYKCPLFAKTCTPENPKGACMVSSEGACAAYYKYERQ